MNSKRPGVVDVVAKWLSIITIYVVLVSYGVNVSYYSGYLAQFRISIKAIAYWPSLYDFATNSVLYITAIIISIVIFVVTLVFVNFAAQRIRKRKWKLKWVGRISAGFITSRRYRLICSIVVAVVLAIITIYHTSSNTGMKDAINQKNFTQVSELSDDRVGALLIYQNANVGAIKLYNKQTSKFQDGYKLVDLKNLSFENIVIK